MCIGMHTYIQNRHNIYKKGVCVWKKKGGG